MSHNIKTLLQQPKAELHMHLEGSLEPKMMLSLAQKNDVKLKYKNLAEVQKAYNFNNLQEFLDLYYQGMSVLQTADDFYDLTYAYLCKAQQDHVTHTEIFIDPQAHISRGISLTSLFDGVNSAVKKAQIELNIDTQLIMCFLRNL